MRTAKTLIRLGGCSGWSESSLGAQSLCWFLSCRGSDNIDVPGKGYRRIEKGLEGCVRVGWGSSIRLVRVGSGSVWKGRQTSWLMADILLSGQTVYHTDQRTDCVWDDVTDCVTSYPELVKVTHKSLWSVMHSKWIVWLNSLKGVFPHVLKNIIPTKSGIKFYFIWYQYTFRICCRHMGSKDQLENADQSCKNILILPFDCNK